ncbi:DMT family transporter [Qingshengfaniella alkalisoli]|uniref:DMT family transporter n=2 Tax=Qingshengfaniella alkalisoli TaxID=2599296 RepID=A0A5B8IWZ6_9RHOB|nr:DMT family transporter [Qingshengfaniella alkalisoli]
MLGTIASFSAMAVAGRQVSFALDTFEIMTYRSLVGLIVVWTALTVTRRWSQVSTRNWKTQVFRNITHFTGQNLWFFAIASVPLAQVFALEFTSPLWVVLLSPLFLGEQLTRTRLATVVIGFVGILIVTRPTPETINIGIMTAASAAIFFALTNMITKRLTRTETVASIMFWLTGTQLIFGLISAGHDGYIALPDATTAPYLVVIGVAGLMAHFCLTTALSLAPASVVTPIDFARLPVIAVLGMLLFNEAIDPFVILGGAIIFAANYFGLVMERRRRRIAATQVNATNL